MEENYEDVLLEIDKSMNDPKFEEANKRVRDIFY